MNGGRACAAIGSERTSRNPAAIEEWKTVFTVALIGVDGAGKSTVGRSLERSFPLPVKNLYMGVNLDSSNHMLPTTRLLHAVKRLCGAKPDTAGPPDPDAPEPARPRGLVPRAVRAARSGLYLGVQISEECYRQALAWYFQRRRRIVLFDRHYFFDYFMHDVAGTAKKRPLGRRIHGYVLRRVLPRPDLVIYLDAPAETLFARKHEGTLRALEQRRSEYLAMRSAVENFVCVDASRPVDDVVREVAGLIMDFHTSRAGDRWRTYDEPR
jgi:thymidylate kinase